MTPLFLTPFVNDGISVDEDLPRTKDKIVEQEQQISVRLSELERAVHIERENLLDTCFATSKKLARMRNA